MAQRASHYRMPRWFLSALILATMAAGPVSAQFGGIQLPGMGRNRGGYPGGQNPNGQNSNQVYGPTETITGSIQRISSSDLVIDAGDDRIVLIVIQNGTKYLSTMDKVKASDFEPGDHVTVDATRDSNDHYYSKSITMNKKGTAEDKAAAMKAANSSSQSGGSGGSSPDSDPDRPRLHRANSDSGSSGGQSSADTSQNSSTSGAGAAASGGSRPDSSSGNSGSSSTGRSSPTPSANSASSSPSPSDDSGPPVLRRASSSPSTPAPDPSSAPASQPGGVRPSLSADDVNGVTRSPVVTPPTPIVSDGSGRDSGITRSGRYDNSNGGDAVIDEAREAAFSFTDTLPNYVVKQMTNRYATGQASRGRTSWQPLDIVTTDLIYEDGKERYTNIMVNGKPTKYIEQTGSWSEGEFASMLQAILAPGTQADFRNQRSTTIANRAAYRYDYTVEQPRSTWTLHADGQTYKPSYTGAIWVDKATFRVLRIEIAARNLPRDFPLDTAESSIDYDFVLIGDQKVLLPSHAEALSCVRGTPDCTRNQTDFRNYRKYGAETNITFEGTDK